MTHTKTTSQLLTEFETNAETGLTSLSVEKNAAAYGTNALPPPKRISLFRRVFNALKEKMILILLLAWVISLVVNSISMAQNGFELGGVLEIVGILIAIVISVGITVWMEGKSAKAFEALSRVNADSLVKVIRNGIADFINQCRLVCGDIVIVETGDKITADGRLLESTSLSADESSLTGESEPAQKDALLTPDKNAPVAERKNMLYSGCFITSGSGKMVVTAVGQSTEFGLIAKELSSKSTTKTPLQQKLENLGKTITILALLASAVVLIAQFIALAVRRDITFDSVSQTLITSIVLIVAAVPEGLPAIVALTLALNVVKMKKKNSLVKKIIASETSGCVTVICSDKTGTLTENKMTVTQVYCNCSGKFISPEKNINENLLTNFCINSTADILEDTDRQTKFVGNPTECALLIAAQKASVDYHDKRKKTEIEKILAFSSLTKSMTTVIKNADGTHTVYVKGSPEKILDLCSLSESERKVIEEKITAQQKNSARIIAFASGIMTAKNADEFCALSCRGSNLPPDYDNIIQSLSFDGFAAIQDPLRKDVFDAVQRVNSAGIELKMLTGDNIVTATAIANELKLLDSGGIAIESSELEKLSDEDFAERIKAVKVVARCTPSVKMRIVQALKAQGQVVAVTGDGINDAPALKSADIGIAMGIAGTEVSKEASDIVLLDDSFSTIATFIKWGRGIYENFQRFITYRLTANLAAVAIILLSALLGIFLDGFGIVFSAIQLLWINLLMDGPLAITLGLEPLSKDLMQRKPLKRNTSIVSKSMLFRILFNGLFMTAVILLQQGINFLGVAEYERKTVLFAAFALFQFFSFFTARELGTTSIFKTIHKNRAFLIVAAITLVLQIVLIQFAGAFMGTVPLGIITWLKVFGVALSLILVSELTKLVMWVVRKKKRLT